jgi:DNA-binding winged helix-turn-helix (wHTH) protein
MRQPNASTYRVFIASPGDVAEERNKAFKVIDDLNEVWRDSKYPARLECLSWEKSACSSAGPPQGVINKQIPSEELDIFIAILWKRLGTPPKTKGLKGTPAYLSGTQQEIEEAYDSWKRTGRPIIMLYSKDEPVPALMTRGDLRQFSRLNRFLRKFQPGGEYPALVKTFHTAEFEQLLRRELAQVTAELQFGTDEEPRPGAPAELPQKLQPIEMEQPKVKPEDDPEVKNWLAAVGLRENPFRYQNAEDDPALPTYFLRFPELQTVTTNDLMRDRKTWIFEGKEGSGKTALRKSLAARGQPQNPEASIFCIEYDQIQFEQLLNETDDVTLFPINFYKSIYEACLAQYSNIKLNHSGTWQSLNHAQGNLAELAAALRSINVQGPLCLIDPGVEIFNWKGQQRTTSSLLIPVISFPEVGGFCFRYFLTPAVFDELEKGLAGSASKQYRLISIEWNENAIKDIIRKRMTTLSVDQTAPYRSLGEVCDDANNLSSLIDAEIASTAQESPRVAIWLANRLIELHCQESPTPKRITSVTWNAVKVAWSTRGENRILGASEYSVFRLHANKHTSFRNQDIILQGRSHSLFISLVQAKGGFRSKEELIEVGWAGENHLGVSEKALSEAMRRMKTELKQELKRKGFKDWDWNWIKSVRGRGYRLYYPERKTREEGND